MTEPVSTHFYNWLSIYTYHNSLFIYQNENEINLIHPQYLGMDEYERSMTLTFILHQKAFIQCHINPWIFFLDLCLLH